MSVRLWNFYGSKLFGVSDKDLSWFIQETNWPCGFLPSRDVCRVEVLGPNLSLLPVYNMGISVSSVMKFLWVQIIWSWGQRSELVSSGNKLAVRFFAKQGRLPGRGFRAKFKIGKMFSIYII